MCIHLDIYLDISYLANPPQDKYEAVQKKMLALKQQIAVRARDSPGRPHPNERAHPRRRTPAKARARRDCASQPRARKRPAPSTPAPPTTAKHRKFCAAQVLQQDTSPPTPPTPPPTAADHAPEARAHACAKTGFGTVPLRHARHTLDTHTHTHTRARTRLHTQTHARTHTHTRPRTHARAHPPTQSTHTDAHTHTLTPRAHGTARHGTALCRCRRSRCRCRRRSPPPARSGQSARRRGRMGASPRCGGLRRGWHHEYNRETSVL
jgi:hypothetical protein